MPKTSPSATRRAGLIAALLTGGVFALGITANASAATERVSRTLTRTVVGQSRDNYNRDIRVHNQTGWTMTYFYAAGSGTDDWGADLLGSGTLEPGDSVVVTADDGTGACRFDFRAEFDNGESLQRTGINVCQVADYYFTR